MTAVEDGAFRLDDGTATARIVLAGTAADLLTMLRPGDALNATGTVETGEETVVVVADRADVVLVGVLGASEPVDPAGTTAVAGQEDSAAIATRMAAAAALAVAGRGAVPAAVLAAIGMLSLTAVMGGVALLAHRRRSRRLQRARLVARLDAITGPGTPPAAPAPDLPA